MTLRDEAESKLDKFSSILEADLLNLKALKELSWQGVPRKVSCAILKDLQQLQEFISSDACSNLALVVWLLTNIE